ncbi:MAG: DUF4842 domain-containing protein [Bacteroidetes bacterium]|nr:DUF4842 domain-containing protein [Bacteroidota bacterium]MBU1373161.1 DUF4842 domain-containing protein [Bacteroidota bacterium]MBU1484343.1 DUF4842 domain-containing protein [Bacteroidota bacterium]MBU1761747.1 DUF4842 domain-containing protein [Bacteroidota bacterium]MBU2266790.1 DUF4842 domain-containing protein [Bacteroidota bacterium]
MKNFKSKLTLFCSALLALSSCQKDNLAPQQSAISKTVTTSGLNLTSQVPSPCIQRSLVAGQNTIVGVVDVAMGNQGDLYLTYNITKPNVYILEAHADIFKSIEQFKNDKKISGGGAVPGKFQFRNAFTTQSKTTSYTVIIPKAYVNQYMVNGMLFITTHAKLSTGDSAWAGITKDGSKGSSLENALQFPGANWSVYFDFNTSQCGGMDFTFAWEDLQNEGNDGDYNDLVVQADGLRSGNELKLTFKIVARGSYYDHQFKIKIPMAGITRIIGTDGIQSTYTNDGTDYIITVFGSTKLALPPNGAMYDQTNTFPEFPCVPFAVKEITLQVNGDFVYNTSKPYIPFISVYPSGAAPSSGGNYDLSIFDFSGQDTWVSADGKVYPNGIIVPKTWRWPFERVNITGPYPLFPANNWASNLADASLTFDPNRCQ